MGWLLERETIPIAGRDDLVIQVTDDGSRTLVNPNDGLAFHSASGARTETEHVYLHNSGVSDRLAKGLKTRVLEIGLGTALGMLMTVDRAVTARCALHYHAWELKLLEADLFEMLNLGTSVKHSWLVESFVSWRKTLGNELAPGEYQWTIPARGSSTHSTDQIVVILCVGDWLKSNVSGLAAVDAVYYDPFAPAANPELWQVASLARMRQLLTLDGRLTTYCVSREVRDRFSEAGFRVTKVRGPKGGKREVLIATPSVSLSASPPCHG